MGYEKVRVCGKERVGVVVMKEDREEVDEVVVRGLGMKG